MITLKEALLNISRKIFFSIVIPVFIGIVIALLIMILLILNHEKQNLTNILGYYEEEIRGIFTSVEDSYHPVILEEFSSIYYSGLSEGVEGTHFSEKDIDHLKSRISRVSFDRLEIDGINYYRISPEGVIYDTDYATDLGLDLSEFQTFWASLDSLESGEIKLIPPDDETRSGRIRLYSYIRLPDGDIFETGIAFKGFNEQLEEMGAKLLGAYGNSISIYRENFNKIMQNVKLTDNDKTVFRQIEGTDETELKVFWNFTSKFYDSWQSEYGTYYFLVQVNLYYLYFILLIFIFLLAGFFFIIHSTREKTHRFSKTITGPVERLDSEMMAFDPESDYTGKIHLQTDIKELSEITESFNTMRVKVEDSFEEIRAINQELESAYEENEYLVNRFEAFLESPSDLFAFEDTDQFLITAFEKLFYLIPNSDYGFVTKADKEKVSFLYGKGHDYERLNSLGISSGHFRNHQGVRITNDSIHDFADRFGLVGEDRMTFLEALNPIAQMILIPLYTDKTFYGHLSLHSAKVCFNDQDLKVARYFSNYVKTFLMIREYSSLEETFQKETIHSMIKLLEHHDPYTRGHSENVARLASEFAEFIGLGPEKVKSLYWAGIIHDLGKVLIPHNILNKPDKLTLEEYEFIKKHPVLAYDVFKKNQTMKEISIYIRHHHERYDGKGYPDGLSGTGIPFESRILTIADSWDAMTRDRVYREALSYEKALEEMEKNRGLQFDPELIDEWLRFCGPVPSDSH